MTPSGAACRSRDFQNVSAVDKRQREAVGGNFPGRLVVYRSHKGYHLSEQLTVAVGINSTFKRLAVPQNIQIPAEGIYTAPHGHMT